MGMFSGLFGGGGSTKRAAQAAADKAAEARGLIKSESERLGAYYEPYRQAGERAIGQQQEVSGDISGRISGLDPKIAALYEQQADLQPQVSEMYTLAQQQDPILAQLTSGDFEAYKQTPGYQFRLREGQRTLEQSAAARGGLFSGGTGKSLQRYGQEFATQEYDNYLRRLRGQLKDVGTQLAGRQTALGAGQGQINAGINLLDQDYKQIAAQMGLSGEYQNLINQGASAADAAARLGFSGANIQAGLTKGIGETYASGMQAKDAQMKGAGEQWLGLGAAGYGIPQFRQTPVLGQQQGKNQGMLQTMPQPGVNMPQGPSQPAQPWQDPDVARAAQQQARSASSFDRRRYA